MVPDSRKSVIHHGVVPEIVSSDRAVVVGLVRRNPVDRKSGMILGRDICIQSAVVLGIIDIRSDPWWCSRRYPPPLNSDPPPTPGFEGPVQWGSCVPRGVVNGDPDVQALPGMVMQFTPSVRPAFWHVWLMMLLALTAAPGVVRNLDAMLPEAPARQMLEFHTTRLRSPQSCSVLSRRQRMRRSCFARLDRQRFRPTELNLCVSFSNPRCIRSTSR